MLSDDPHRRNDLNRHKEVGSRDKVGAMIIGTLAVAGIVGALFMLAPWRGDRTASNNSPGTTVGSSTNSPAPPASREPAIPAAPTTAR